MRFTLAGKLALLVAADTLAVAAVAAGAAAAGLPPVTILLVSLLAGWPLAVWSLGRFWEPVRSTLAAVTDGVRGFQENDFSLRVAERHDELGELVALYNGMGDALKLERNEIYQRELLLDTVLQGAPMAILLVNELGRITYSNAAARRLFEHGRLAGRALAEAVRARPEIGRAISEGEDALVAWRSDPGGEEETYRVLTRWFTLNTQRNRLVVLERITPELRRNEVEVWKKAIRVMSHELNNSLAPISSLVHSARTLASRPGVSGRLDEVFGSVEERVRHLSGFLEGYARFARLPAPRKRPVEWKTFLEEIRPLFPFRCDMDAAPAAGYFDPAQMQQVVINLLKNASESGSAAGEVSVFLEGAPDGSSLLHVLDRGRGMDAETMRHALLPFYSSKPAGAGLGLPLCNEILSAHGGRLIIRARGGGGTVVTCVLPRRESMGTALDAIAVS